MSENTDLQDQPEDDMTVPTTGSEENDVLDEETLEEEPEPQEPPD